MDLPREVLKSDLSVKLQKACVHVDCNLATKTWEYAIATDGTSCLQV